MCEVLWLSWHAKHLGWHTQYWLQNHIFSYWPGLVAGHKHTLTHQSYGQCHQTRDIQKHWQTNQDMLGTGFDDEILGGAW